MPRLSAVGISGLQAGEDVNTQSLAALISTSDTSEMQRPWQRVIVTPELWNTLSQGLGMGDWSLLGLWGEASAAKFVRSTPNSVAPHRCAATPAH